jgi:hypothetical protein
MKNKYKIIAVIVAVLVAAFFYMGWQINSLKTQLAIAKNNVAALKDTVRVVKTKNGELETVKLALMADKKSLKDLSDSLYKEVKNEKGSVKYITKAGATIKLHVTIEVPSISTDSTIQWAYDREDSGGSRHLAGISTRATTKITRDELSLTLITGLKERDDKKMEIFIRTKYPGVTFTDIEGAIIDPTKAIVKPPDKRFGFGPCASIILDPTGAIRYGIGVSVQWSLLKF